jgi:hypothetical protein
MIESLPRSKSNILGFQLSGRLHDKDYQQFVPVIDAAVAQYGKVRLLALFHDFKGWDPHALWDDIKFSSKHCHDVERIALVGDKRWEHWMAAICKPFTQGVVRYFDVSETEQAWAWLEEE